MGKSLQFGLALLLLLAGRGRAAGGEIIDRVAGTVNGTVILQSDLEDAVRYGGLAEGHPVLRITPEQTKAALERLIDQQLLRQQMGMGRFRVQPAAVQQRLAEIRQQYPEAASEQGWRALLQQYGLQEQELQDYVTAQLQLLRFVDLRLRPGVQIEPSSIAAYYREKFLPQLRQAGVTREVPLAQVAGQIEEVLVQQRVDELLLSWLQSLRKQSVIRMELPAYSPGLKTAPSTPAGVATAPREEPGGSNRTWEAETAATQ